MWELLGHNTKQLLIALDQLGNVALCFILRELAWADETLSSHCWRWEQDGVRAWPRKLVDWGARVIFRDPDHCAISYWSEKIGNQLPPELRPKPKRKREHEPKPP